MAPPGLTRACPDIPDMSGGLGYDPVAPAGFGLVERYVRALHERVHPVGVRLERRHADAHRDLDRPSVSRHHERGAGDLGAYALRHLLGDRRLGVRHHDDELLAAVAAGEIYAPHVLSQPRGEFAQDAVAAVMA